MINKLVIAGDTHLRPQTWQNRPDIQGDAYSSFKQITEYCIKHKCNLALAGDVFNSVNPSSRSISEFVASTAGVAAAGCNIYVIQGQHDRSEPPWPSAVFESKFIVYAHKRIIAPIAGLNMYCLDNLDPGAFKEAMAAVPQEANALMVHQLAKQSLSFDGSWSMDLNDIPKHIKWVFAGDLHQTISLKQPVEMYYTGSTYMCKIDEQSDKSFLLITSDSGKISVERIPLVTRSIVKQTVTSDTELEALVTQLSAQITSNEFRSILLVNYAIDIPNAEARLRLAADRANMHLWASPFVLRLDGVVLDQDAPGTGSAADSLPKFVNRNDNLFAFLSELLEQPADAVFKRYRPC
jgi:DNA repair exonuclease SbcCD nuclease subunit